MQSLHRRIVKTSVLKALITGMMITLMTKHNLEKSCSLAAWFSFSKIQSFLCIIILLNHFFNVTQDAV